MPSEVNETPIWSVSQLTAEVRQTINENPRLRTVWVQGEVSNMRRPASGHCYFTLKDSDAALKCVLFRSYRRNIAFDLQDGQDIIAQGSIDVYERNGEYQLYVRRAEPAGRGALYLAWEQLKEKLEKEELFSQDRKRPLPQFPSTVGIVTSVHGAALRDIVNVIKRRFPAVNIVVKHSPVQGEGAGNKLLEALTCQLEYGAADVIIIGRGGGSFEDLWEFNNEHLVRAVADSTVPIVSAVGHETDVSLCDMAADVRAPTPSAAAELVVKDAAYLRKYLQSTANAMARRLRFITETQRQRIKSAVDRTAFVQPARLTADKRQTVDELSMRLQRAANETVHNKKSKLSAQLQKLKALDPKGVLARGYSITLNNQGEVISDADAAEIEERLSMILHRGQLEAVVKSRRSDGN